MFGRQARRMPGILKTFNHLFRNMYQDRQVECLVSHMYTEPAEHVDEDPRQQTCCLVNTTHQRGSDPQMYTQDSAVPGLTDTPSEDSYFQGLKDAAEQVKNCAVRPDENGGSGSYSQCRLKVYLTAVERFVDNNFPALPTNSEAHIGKYLNDAMTLVCSKVTALVPVLEDSELVSYLLDNYNRHLFGTLSLLMDRCSSVKASFLLLEWVKNTYFRQDHKGCLVPQTGVLSLSDPLLLADWLVYSKQKVLTLLQDNISTTLHNILQHDKSNGVCDESDEEVFIQVYLDVIQCLDAHIKASKLVSHTLKDAVQRLCCNELHSFMERYMNAHRVEKANLLCHFRTILTCRQLRSYALNITDLNNNTDSSTLLMLKKMETLSLSSVQQSFANIAKDSLRMYFNKEDRHLEQMMAVIKNMLATLPQIEQGKETKQLIVKAAYHSVTRAYLQCLMQTKYKKLEKQLDDVEKRIMLDAERFHSFFAQQSGGDDKQKMILLKMGEILQCCNVDSLKDLCSDLFVSSSEESKEYIPAMLHWKGELSRRQIKKIIDVSREAEVEDHVTRHPRMCRWSCLC